MTRPSIAAVIVNWNSCQDVLAALRSLREQTDPDLHMVVVDNGSKDDSAAAIRAAFPDVTVVDAGENLGFAEGCNRGIARVRADWVLLFNNDALAEMTFVAELRRAATAAPDDVGMLQPLIVFTSRPTHVNSSGVVVFSNGQAQDRHFAEPVQAAEAAGAPFCSTAGAALYRRSMLEALRLRSGYLDRDFFMYYEDVDLGWRCRLAGYRALYVPAARVRHRFQGSSHRRGASFATNMCRVNRIAALLHNASWRFIVRSWRLTVEDALRVRREVGLAPLLGLARRAPILLRDRLHVGRLSRVDRRALEREWCATPVYRPPALELPDRDA